MAKKAAEAEKATVGAKETTEEEKAAEAATADPGSASSDPAPPPTATSVSPTAPGVGEPAEFQIGMRYWAHKKLPDAIAELKEKPLSNACWLILEDGVNKGTRLRFPKTKMTTIAKAIQVLADKVVASEVATEVAASDVAEQQQAVAAEVATTNWENAANVWDE